MGCGYCADAKAGTGVGSPRLHGGAMLEHKNNSFYPGLVISELKFPRCPRSGCASLRVHVGLDVEKASGCYSVVPLKVAPGTTSVPLWQDPGLCMHDS